ncbi:MULTISPECIES: creatininase family protein [unclassified Beijerinckia]|uniref:creatininase family protein n=1 Tax=unclassified Beijerinckia TaxID=2638183 RepID=UPI00089BA710|nr:MULTISPECIES: creatininase family protein [unclassified Beijerinckia]MDH7799163.1 creatinine amidohydrolase [Beijerinckia sp. GAS462]SED93185.1 creatinine amidohydrolase [Beijerinckia sp. 28-YEA-48]
MAKSVWLHELTWPDIAEYLERQSVVMVPVGATEQHGHHTPLLVDTAWASDVSEAVAKQEGVLVTPPMHFGWSPHHLAYPGGITLRPETLTQVCVDIGESLISHGFKKIIFVNGNRVANLPPMQIAMAKLRFKTGAYVAIIDTHLIARKEVCEAAGNGRDASHHAGNVETSFMLHAHPELVRVDKIMTLPDHPLADFASNLPMDPPLDQNIAFNQPTAAEFYKRTQGHGTYSNPAAATAEIGKAVLDVTIKRAAQFIAHVKTLDVQCERCPIPI